MPRPAAGPLTVALCPVKLVDRLRIAVAGSRNQRPTRTSDARFDVRHRPHVDRRPPRRRTGRRHRRPSAPSPARTRLTSVRYRSALVAEYSDGTQRPRRGPVCWPTTPRAPTSATADPLGGTQPPSAGGWSCTRPRSPATWALDRDDNGLYRTVLAGRARPKSTASEKHLLGVVTGNRRCRCSPERMLTGDRAATYAR